jgi:hypothetical protein
MVGGFKQLPRIRPTHHPNSGPAHPSMFVAAIFSEPLEYEHPAEALLTDHTAAEVAPPADPDIFPEPLECADPDWGLDDEVAAPVATAADDDEFDEDGRLLLTEPLKPLPRPAATILHPQAPRDRPTVRFAPGDIARISAARGIDMDDETTWR